MWYYMIACYFLSLITLGMVGVGFFQSFLKFPLFHANHPTWMIFTSIVYFFTETLVIFFFVGAGMGVKEFSEKQKMGPEFYRDLILVKRKVYPPLLLNILFMIVLFVLVGAVDTYHFPSRAYPFVFLGCLLHLVKSKGVQHQAFRETAEIVFKISQVRKGL